MKYNSHRILSLKANLPFCILTDPITKVVNTCRIAANQNSRLSKNQKISFLESDIAFGYDVLLIRQLIENKDRIHNEL